MKKWKCVKCGCEKDVPSNIPDSGVCEGCDPYMNPPKWKFDFWSFQIGGAVVFGSYWIGRLIDAVL